MRIVCPYCGERGNDEFSYLGDASPVRPDPAVADVAQKFADYVYLRDNPRGVFRELWYHTAGCHAWLQRWVLDVSDRAAYMALLDVESLRVKHHRLSAPVDFGDE